MDVKAQPNSEDDNSQEKQTDFHPHTTIKVLQAVGAELEIDPSLLSTDKLMADPKDDSSSSSV